MRASRCVDMPDGDVAMAKVCFDGTSAGVAPAKERRVRFAPTVHQSNGVDVVLRGEDAVMAGADEQRVCQPTKNASHAVPMDPPPVNNAQTVGIAPPSHQPAEPNAIIGGKDVLQDTNRKRHDFDADPIALAASPAKKRKLDIAIAGGGNVGMATALVRRADTAENEPAVLIPRAPNVNVVSEGEDVVMARSTEQDISQPVVISAQAVPSPSPEQYSQYITMKSDESSPSTSLDSGIGIANDVEDTVVAGLEKQRVLQSLAETDQDHIPASPPQDLGPTAVEVGNQGAADVADGAGSQDSAVVSLPEKVCIPSDTTAKASSPEKENKTLNSELHQNQALVPQPEEPLDSLVRYVLQAIFDFVVEDIVTDMVDEVVGVVIRSSDGRDTATNESPAEQSILQDLPQMDGSSDPILRVDVGTDMDGANESNGEGMDTQDDANEEVDLLGSPPPEPADGEHEDWNVDGADNAIDELIPEVFYNKGHLDGHHAGDEDATITAVRGCERPRCYRGRIIRGSGTVWKAEAEPQV